MDNRHLIFKMLDTSVVLILVAVSILLIRFFLADIYYAKSFYGNGIKLLNQAVNLNPFEPSYRKQYAAVLAETAKRYSEKGGNDELVEILIENANKQVGVAVKLNSNNSLTLKSTVDTLLKLSRLNADFSSKTLLLIDKLLDLSPTDPQIRLKAAKIYFEYGDRNEAAQRVEEALLLKPDYKDALDFRGTILKQ